MKILHCRKLLHAQLFFILPRSTVVLVQEKGMHRKKGGNSNRFTWKICLEKEKKNNRLRGNGRKIKYKLECVRKIYTHRKDENNNNLHRKIKYKPECVKKIYTLTRKNENNNNQLIISPIVNKQVIRLRRFEVVRKSWAI